MPRSDPRSQIESLLERHLPSLRSYVRKNMDAALLKRESCADLVQSVCREVLEKRGSYRYQGDDAFQSWLYQVALHKLMDRRRYWNAVKRAPAEMPRPKVRSGLWSESELARLAITLGTPSRDAMLQEELAQLENALAALAAADREVIRLVHIEGLSHAEVGEKLGCTEPQSRKRLFHAIARLSKGFVHAAPGGGAAS